MFPGHHCPLPLALFPRFLCDLPSPLCCKSLSRFLGSQLSGFISFLVYCYICFPCFVHIPRGLLAAHRLFKANLRKQISFLPAKAAGSRIPPFNIRELWSVIPEGRGIWQSMRKGAGGEGNNYQIGIHSNNELIENSGYNDVRDPQGTVDSLKKNGDKTRDCDPSLGIRDVPRNRWDPF